MGQVVAVRTACRQGFEQSDGSHLLRRRQGEDITGVVEIVGRMVMVDFPISYSFVLGFGIGVPTCQPYLRGQE